MRILITCMNESQIGRIYRTKLIAPIMRTNDRHHWTRDCNIYVTLCYKHVWMKGKYTLYK